MEIKIPEIGFHLCSLPGNASNKSEPPHECLVLCLSPVVVGTGKAGGGKCSPGKAHKHCLVYVRMTGL